LSSASFVYATDYGLKEAAQGTALIGVNTEATPAALTERIGTIVSDVDEN